MKLFDLYRYNQDTEKTQGILQVEGIYACDTLELPWKDNEEDISCIPEGEYYIRNIHSSHNGNCIEILEVPNRTGIQIHSANWISQLRGCIAVGVKSENSVLHSKDKLAILIKLLGNDKGILSIKRI